MLPAYVRVFSRVIFKILPNILVMENNCDCQPERLFLVINGPPMMKLYLTLAIYLYVKVIAIYCYSNIYEQVAHKHEFKKNIYCHNFRFVVKHQNSTTQKIKLGGLIFNQQYLGNFNFLNELWLNRALYRTVLVCLPYYGNDTYCLFHSGLLHFLQA